MVNGNILKAFGATFRRIIASPVGNVVAMVVVILAVVFGVRLFVKQETKAQLRFVENRADDQMKMPKDTTDTAAAPEIFGGEAYDTTIRLRESGALAFAMSMAVFAVVSETGRVPADLEKVWSAAATRGLLPPGINVVNGVVKSDKNMFSIRYRPQPLAFEVIARPSESQIGSEVLLRFPSLSADGRTISYFLSDASRGSAAPPPFSEAESLAASGWTLRQWRGEILTNGGELSSELESERRLLRELAEKR